jgi:hypothetical protein
VTRSIPSTREGATEVVVVACAEPALTLRGARAVLRLLVERARADGLVAEGAGPLWHMELSMDDPVDHRGERTDQEETLDDER